MSSASDNSIKHWIFDGAEETGRLLRFRSGHSAPPTCVLHYGQVRVHQGEPIMDEGREGWRGREDKHTKAAQVLDLQRRRTPIIHVPSATATSLVHTFLALTPLFYVYQGERLLSAGRDRAFRLFSVIQDQQSRELSQRPGGGAAKRARQLGLKQEDLKLTRLTGMAAGQVSAHVCMRGWAFRSLCVGTCSHCYTTPRRGHLPIHACALPYSLPEAVPSETPPPPFPFPSGSRAGLVQCHHGPRGRPDGVRMEASGESASPPADLRDALPADISA